LRKWGIGNILAANFAFNVSLAGQDLQGRLDNTTTQAQDQVEGGLLLDVVVSQRAAVLKLLASEDQALLVRRNTSDYTRIGRFARSQGKSK
jgi:hypothetical protein